MKRRDALELVVIGAAAPMAAQQHRHAAPDSASGTAPRALTRGHFELTDRLADMIIPADAHSPGAHEARVAATIDEALAMGGAAAKAAWISGLESVDAESKRQHGKTFLGCSAAQQDRILRAMAEGEESPKTLLHRFFKDLKARTIAAYYSSSVGLLKDLQYKGIVPLAEFPGCNHPDHQRR